MTELAIFPIVEGHGEVRAVPKLLHRIWTSIPGQSGVLRVLEPFRVPRGKMTKDGDPELIRALKLGRHKLAAADANHSMILLLLDADDDCDRTTHPEGLGVSIVTRCRSAASDLDIVVVAADKDYEAWLLAGSDDEQAEFAEGHKGKPRLQSMLGRWSETVDQPSWTLRVEIARARANSRSFDKVCREIERRSSRGAG